MYHSSPGKNALGKVALNVQDGSYQELTPGLRKHFKKGDTRYVRKGDGYSLDPIQGEARVKLRLKEGLPEHMAEWDGRQAEVLSFGSREEQLAGAYRVARVVVDDCELDWPSGWWLVEFDNQPEDARFAQMHPSCPPLPEVDLPPAQD
eukprot:TRINITY_DN3615_c0_g1_i3.p2 TRINITY_DN3615_c0_g1~~TRINITY_DN3615_c0_g1_i3.p2  ORF type:complete len:148 (+),score=35.60 TRINITY_DN3615_c0_g1_i3:178-621(+)